MADRKRFHRRCGDRVTLLNDNGTAIRNYIDFNHGLIMSDAPLKDDDMFEVNIDRRVNAWDGSLEIGVTTLDPEHVDLPATASKLRNTAWILSGNSILRDGSVFVRSYGTEISSTHLEGDRMGVMRTSNAELMFFINGRCMGVAVRDVPERLFAVIDLYGQCVQVTITNPEPPRPMVEPSLEVATNDPNNDDGRAVSEVEINTIVNRVYHKTTKEYSNNMATETACSLANADCLRFHPRCGILVQLTANNKVAERARPLDDYNNGVVMTHRPLFDCELFEIRIEQLVDKWSGSIEVGVTTHNPATMRFPSTMTNMDTGTIMMSGCKVLINGHGTNMEYGTFNLDELREGDTVGMMRKNTGELHYFINGFDMGVASDKVDPQVWGVIDLYGMTVKVSIVDPSDPSRPINVVGPRRREMQLPTFQGRATQRLDGETLLFHSLRDSNVTLLNHGSTAHRPNAFELYNNGIVMTNRTLRANELFQVRLDLVITKWAGSIEIGVTQLSCNEIKFPFKLSNPHSATWAMSGEDVTWDGLVLIPQYVRNLSRLREGDTVGVMRKDTGTLHFFLNGVDLGPAAYEVPDHVFGIIDLYGRAAQATLVDAYVPPSSSSPESTMSSESNLLTLYPDLCFHHLHGRNARLSRNRMTATRATVNSEFNDAVLFSNRPLRECEMFEIRIDTMVDCWIGSLEIGIERKPKTLNIGVTSIRPEQLETPDGLAIAGTATDLSWDTYILSGSAVIKDGECIRSWYPLDLDTVNVGSRIGMMWHPDRSLHFYLDGLDQGKAWYIPHPNIYAVVDLYGMCTQVTIMQPEERHHQYTGRTMSENSVLSNPRSFLVPCNRAHFSEYHGSNIVLMKDYSQAKRLNISDPNDSLVFSSGFLVPGETFEIKILETSPQFNGCMRFGVTSLNILNFHVHRHLPSGIKMLPHFTAFIAGNILHYSKSGPFNLPKIRTVTPSLGWLRPGDRIGLKKCPNDPSIVRVYYNYELLETVIEDVPDRVYVIMELYGATTKIQAMSKPSASYPSVMQPLAATEDLPMRTPRRTYKATIVRSSQEQTPGSAYNEPEADEPTNQHYEPQFNRPPLAGRATGVFATTPNGGVFATTNDVVATPEEFMSTTNRVITHSQGMCRSGSRIYANPSGVYTAVNTRIDTPTGSIEIAGGMFFPSSANGCPPPASPPLPPSPPPPVNGFAPPPPPPPPAPEDAASPSDDGLAYLPPRTTPSPTPPPYDEVAALDQAMQDCSGICESRKRRYPVPHTFHNVHGRNIALCSSDTVATRITGHKDGVAVVNHPLRRGNSFKFRVDKVIGEWEGSVAIGAIDRLPTEPLPHCATNLCIDYNAWVTSSDMVTDGNRSVPCVEGSSLVNVAENSVLTVVFRFSGVLLILLDGRLVRVAGVVPPHVPHIYPVIDLYGRVCQVSIVFHPLVNGCGASLDFPIEENITGDYMPTDDENLSHFASSNKRRRALSNGNVPLPSPSPITPPPEDYSPKMAEYLRFAAAAAEAHAPRPDTPPMDQSYPIYEDDQGTSHSLEDREFFNQQIQKSQSIQNFRLPQQEGIYMPQEMAYPRAAIVIPDDDDEEEEVQPMDLRVLPPPVEPQHSADGDEDEGPGEAAGGGAPRCNDSNIERNDQYPEANAGVALVEHVSPAQFSIPENISQLITVHINELSDPMIRQAIRANLGMAQIEPHEQVYLQNLMDNLEDTEARQVSEWDAPDEGCEHLHLVLKFWNSLFVNNPELKRELINWSLVRCYCRACRPDPDPFSGWVRLERRSGVGDPFTHRFWAMDQTILGQLTHNEGPVEISRPEGLTSSPYSAPSNAFVSVWQDEERKPHHTATVIEIQTGDVPADDRLVAILIFLQHLTGFNRVDETYVSSD